jgi:HEAT repeat protein
VASRSAIICGWATGAVPLWWLTAPTRRGGAVRRVRGVHTMDEILARMRHQDAAKRVEGYIALGDAALNHQPAMQALLAHAEAGCADPDTGVRDSVAHALGQQSNDQRCVPLLIRLLDDADAGVRRSAAFGLGITLEQPSATHPAVRALIARLADPAPVVRDAAAFVLGDQLDVDSPNLRAGLRRLLHEPDTAEAYPAAEAAFGLARRADPEVHAVITERLGRPHVGSLWLRAAGELGDPRLRPALLRLRAPDNEADDPWVQDLENAIHCCAAPGGTRALPIETSAYEVSKDGEAGTGIH